MQNEKPYKILIAGLGGVGGYFGGRLAHFYHDDTSVEIYFLARGEHLNAMKQNGLRVETSNDSFSAYPRLASDNAADFDKVDLILFTTKTYSLATVVEQVKECISPSTLLLPLMNGVDGYEFLKKQFPNNHVLNGCAYIISMIKAPGVIANVGNIERLMFGGNSAILQLETVLSIFKKAEIDIHLNENIDELVWGKFIFISAIASATSFYNSTVGEILEDKNKLNILKGLIFEVCEVARKKDIHLAEEFELLTLTNIKKMPSNTTTSMSRDFANGNKTELDSLTKYVLEEGKRFDLKMEIYEEVYRELIK